MNRKHTHFEADRSILIDVECVEYVGGVLGRVTTWEELGVDDFELFSAYNTIRTSLQHKHHVYTYIIRVLQLEEYFFNK